MTLITVCVDSVRYRAMSRSIDRDMRLGLWMSCFARHIVGRMPASGILLAERQERVLRQAGGQFWPSTYLAVGSAKYLGPPMESPEFTAQDDEILLDCGLGLDVSQRYRPSVSRLPLQELIDGYWIAALGNLYVMDPSRTHPGYDCKPVAAALLDIRTGAVGFGTIKHWNLDQTLPYDPDSIPFPTVFVTLEVYAERGVSGG